jgi:hypothetical protein
MSAIANVVINDGAASPVAHTFSPVSIVGDLAKLADRSGGIAIGFPVITQSIRSPGNGLRTYKVMMKVSVPTLDVVAGSTTAGTIAAPSLAFTCLANVEFVLPERSSLSERKNILAYVRNYLATSVAASAVQDLEPLY